MNDKRYLYRGFHPDKKGKTTIVVNGDKIKGEWIYWDCFGACTRPFARTVRGKRIHVDYLFPSDIIPETVGQWVTTDKNGKDVFEGDIAKVITCFGDILVGYVWYDDMTLRHWVKNDDTEQRADFTYLKSIEGYQNKWECEV